MKLPVILRCCFLLLCGVALTGNSAEPQSQIQQFVYVLRLVPRLYSAGAWTKEDNEAVQRHFVRLQDAAKQKQVILAGRTLEEGAKTIGLVIFEARNEEEATAFMKADPAVMAGVMTAELHPYRVAVSR
jgi:uncharacterized protein YciI